MDRAYSFLEIKAIGDAGGKRTFKGIASTPTADRSGDIVEPGGAEFKLPLPLLWQHNSQQPIGWVTAARVTDKGIEVDCEVADIPEPGVLKDQVDMAWQMLKSKLVQGLSIGFSALESTRIENTYSFRFIKWLWLELSAVTVPANGDCSIALIKSVDKATLRTASGERPVVRLDNPPAPTTGTSAPGDSGPAQTRRKGVVYLN